MPPRAPLHPPPGVSRPIVREHFQKIGRALSWHGSLSIDYFLDERTGQPSYIDANPRITEPMNAVVNGINLAELQVQLSLGREIRPLSPVLTSLKSHSTIQAMMGAAGGRHSRLDVMRELKRVVLSQGIYKNSHEGMTPLFQDFPSTIALAVVLLTLLINPQSGQHLAQETITSYSLGSTIPRLSAMKPEGL